MTSQIIQGHNVTAVRRYFDALADGDVGRVLCSLDDQVVLQIPATMNQALEGAFQDPIQFRPTGIYTGREAVRLLLVALKSGFGVQTLELCSVEGQDNRVILAGRLEVWNIHQDRWHEGDWVQTASLNRGKISRLKVCEASEVSTPRPRAA